MSGTKNAIRSLTPRERQVLVLITQGVSVKQIAEDAGLAEGTVKIYISNVLRKLGVQTRIEALCKIVALAGINLEREITKAAK